MSQRLNINKQILLGKYLKNVDFLSVNRMVLFAKLFLVMGIPWIFEVISSTTQQGVIIPIYFKILDMINIFQAVAIFIIFVIKVDIRNSLENKYPRFQRKFKKSYIAPFALFHNI